MSILLTADVKVLVTSSVDTNTGVIDLSALTSINTLELPVIRGSLSFDYETNHEYLPTYGGFANEKILDSYAYSTTQLSDLKFSTYLSTKAGVAVDKPLWECLSGLDTVLAEGVASNVFLSANRLPKYFGVLILFKGVAYVFNSCVINSADLSLSNTALCSTAWSLSSNNVQQILDVTATSTEITGGITGTFTNYTPDGYAFSAGKLLKVLVTDLSSLTSYTLASRGTSVSVKNNYQYINTGTTFGALTSKPVLAGKISAGCEAGTSFYIKADAQTLLTDYVTTNGSSTYKPFYSCVIEATSNTGTKLFDINLTNTVLTMSTNVGQAVEATAQLKLVEGTAALTSSIKFYS